MLQMKLSLLRVLLKQLAKYAAFDGDDDAVGGETDGGGAGGRGGSC